MRALSAAELLHVWERADDRHPIDRALAILCAACPGHPAERLAQLPVGRRDTLLLTLRRQMFGPQLPSFGQCPRCATKVEFSVTIDDLLQIVSPRNDTQNAPDEPTSAAHVLETEEYAVQFRLPNSFDLAAVVHCGDARQARDNLLSRCVLHAKRGDLVTPAVDLPDRVVALLGERIAELDPLAEVQLDLGCPDCELRWQVTLDIASFLWTEISVRATRILREVHLLARAYAWRETDILAMSARRRQYYLDIIR